jgi:ubiquinone/menaquinone biosynthesis C-methylase UbiE
MNNPLRTLFQERYELPSLLKMLSSHEFDSVLEIGCGNGNGTRLIRKYLNPSQITAIDLDDKMIQIAQEKNNDPSTAFKIMDASKLDFPDQSFDAIFDFGIIHHIPNWKECVVELKRVLKDGGSLILEDLSIDSFSGFPGGLLKLLLAHPYEQMYTTEEFIRHIEDVGFTINQFKKGSPLIMLKHFFLTANI